jgi:hypothetical protein
MSSSVPIAVPAFMSVAKVALPSDFQVREGQIFGPRIDPQTLLITGVHILVDEYAELGPLYRHEEHFNIQCALATSGGKDDQPSRLQEVYVLYDLLSIAVASQPTLTGTVRLAWCRQLDYAMGYDAARLSVGVLSFEVQCQARVESLS